MPVDRLSTSEWRDSQATRRYPFADGASLRSTSGFVLPDEILIDAALYPVSSSGPLFLAEIELEPGLASLWLGDATNKRLASALVDLQSPVEELPLLDTFGRTAGLLLVDTVQLRELKTWPTGSHLFTPDTAAFAPSTIMLPAVFGLHGFLLDDNTVVAGDVWLVGEDGVVVREVEPGIIRIDIVGDPLFRRRLCSDGGTFSTPRFVRTINDVGPDSLGRFHITEGENLTTDNALRVVTTPDGLRIEVVGQKSG